MQALELDVAQALVALQLLVSAHSLLGVQLFCN